MCRKNKLHTYTSSIINIIRTICKNASLDLAYEKSRLAILHMA